MIVVLRHSDVDPETPCRGILSEIDQVQDSDIRIVRCNECEYETGVRLRDRPEPVEHARADW